MIALPYQRKPPPLHEVLSDAMKDPKFAEAVQKKRDAEGGQKRTIMSGSDSSR